MDIQWTLFFKAFIPAFLHPSLLVYDVSGSKFGHLHDLIFIMLEAFWLRTSRGKTRSTFFVEVVSPRWTFAQLHAMFYKISKIERIIPA